MEAWLVVLMKNSLNFEDLRCWLFVVAETKRRQHSKMILWGHRLKSLILYNHLFFRFSSVFIDMTSTSLSSS